MRSSIQCIEGQMAKGRWRRRGLSPVRCPVKDHPYGYASMSRPARIPAANEDAAGVRRGTWLVAGLLLLGVAAGTTGVWFQRQQTRRCLAFYGPPAARRIAAAPSVEMLLVQPGAAARRLTGLRRIDVSRAPGLVHLRRGLVEDANFLWQPTDGSHAAETVGASTPLPLEAWDVAFVFTGTAASEAGSSETPVSPADRASTTVVVDLDPSGGSLAVVGQPGRIRLGRIGAGLEKWIRSTLGAAR